MLHNCLLQKYTLEFEHSKCEAKHLVYDFTDQILSKEEAQSWKTFTKVKKKKLIFSQKAMFMILNTPAF